MERNVIHICVDSKLFDNYIKYFSRIKKESLFSASRLYAFSFLHGFLFLCIFLLISKVPIQDILKKRYIFNFNFKKIIYLFGAVGVSNTSEIRTFGGDFRRTVK